MLNLPIKILATRKIETEIDTLIFSGIDDLVALWDAQENITSRHLVIVVNATGADATDNRSCRIRLNGDAGFNYNSQHMTGLGAAASTGQSNNLDIISSINIPAANYANAFGGGLALLPHAFNSTNHKAHLSLSGGAEDNVQHLVARWSSAVAITSITLFINAGNFAVGSTFSVGVIDERYLVEEILLAADGTPTFDNIPQGEGDLIVIGYARSDQAAVEDEVLHVINDDSVAGNYPSQELVGRLGVLAAASPVNQECAMVSGDNATALVFGAFVEIWSQYIKGNQPHFMTNSGYHETSGPTSENRLMSGRRDNTEPINKLHYEPNAGTDFKSGSLFSLYRVPKQLIERVELTADQATITFADIPQNFEALQMVVYARSSIAGLADTVTISFNNDVVAANYDEQFLQGQAAVVSATRNVATRRLFTCPGATEGAGEFGCALIMLPGYAETDRHKHYFGVEGRNENQINSRSHRWESLDAITEIDLGLVGGPNFVAGTIVELWGVMRKEGFPPSEGSMWGV